MRHSLTFLAGMVAIAATVLTPEATAQLYKWVDKDGRVQYSDQPPPPDIKNVEQKKLGGIGQAAAGSDLPVAVREAQRRNPVTLYTSTDCGELCVQGRNLLVARGVPYSEKNVSGDKAAMDELVKAAGQAQVPLLMVGANSLKGFETSAWQGALDGGGYPRTNALNSQQRQAQAAAAEKAAKAPPPDPKAPAANSKAPAADGKAPPASAASQPPAAATSDAAKK